MLIEGHPIYIVEDVADLVVSEAQKLAGERPVRLEDVKNVAGRFGIIDLSSLVIPYRQGQRLGLKDLFAPDLRYRSHRRLERKIAA